MAPCSCMPVCVHSGDGGFRREVSAFGKETVADGSCIALAQEEGMQHVCHDMAYTTLMSSCALHAS